MRDDDITIMSTQKADRLKKAEESIKTLQKKSIALVIPENDYSHEHINIVVYKRHLTSDEWAAIKEIFGL